MVQRGFFERRTMKQFPIVRALIEFTALALLVPVLYALFWSMNTFGPIALDEFRTFFMSVAGHMDRVGKQMSKAHPLLLALALWGVALMLLPKLRETFFARLETHKVGVGLLLLSLFFWVIAGHVQPDPSLGTGPTETAIVRGFFRLVAIGFAVAALPHRLRFNLKQAFISMVVRIRRRRQHSIR